MNCFSCEKNDWNSWNVFEADLLAGLTWLLRWFQVLFIPLKDTCQSTRPLLNIQNQMINLVKYSKACLTLFGTAYSTVLVKCLLCLQHNDVEMWPQSCENSLCVFCHSRIKSHDSSKTS